VPSADRGRLLRYAISGGASAGTHYGLGLLLAEGLHVRPVTASSAGFLASVAVSYGLQHAWVFRSGLGHRVAGRRFFTVTAAAFGLNAAVLWLGTDVLALGYPPVQAVALVLIPVLNYALNSRWTFRPAPVTGGVPRGPG
jgi:putative flippase GtrA